MIRLIFTILFFSFSLYCFPQEYVKVWGVEFNTLCLPDRNKWDYEVGFIRNTELQYYSCKRSGNVRIKDMVLMISARNESYNRSNYTPASLILKFKGD